MSRWVAWWLALLTLTVGANFVICWMVLNVVREI